MEDLRLDLCEVWCAPRSDAVPTTADEVEPPGPVGPRNKILGEHGLLDEALDAHVCHGHGTVRASDGAREVGFPRPVVDGCGRATRYVRQRHALVVEDSRR